MVQDCELCNKGSRHYALNSDNKPIYRNWDIYHEDINLLPKEPDKNVFCTYFVCAKNTFAITDKCKFYQKK